eukprot:Clim_evm31s158 gene=Clim_evmTU31s158
MRDIWHLKSHSQKLVFGVLLCVSVVFLWGISNAFDLDTTFGNVVFTDATEPERKFEHDPIFDELKIHLPNSTEIESHISDGIHWDENLKNELRSPPSQSFTQSRWEALEFNFMHHEESVLFIYVATGRYQNYIPLVLFYNRLIIPSSCFLFFVGEQVHEDVQKAILSMNETGDLDPHCVHFRAPTKDTNWALNRRLSQAVRWVDLDDIMLRYPYHYIGDVDIAMMPETPDFLSQHLLQMRQLDLPFSNADRYYLRSQKERDQCMTAGHKTFHREKGNIQDYCHRFTGLHFVATREYYTGALSAILRMREFLTQAVKDQNGNAEKVHKVLCEHYTGIHIASFCDEAVLHALLKESTFGDRIESLYQSRKPLQEYKDVIRFRPHHGIHLNHGRLNTVHNYCTKADKESYGRSWCDYLHAERYPTLSESVQPIWKQYFSETITVVESCCPEVIAHQKKEHDKSGR